MSNVGKPIANQSKRERASVECRYEQRVEGRNISKGLIYNSFTFHRVTMSNVTKLLLGGVRHYAKKPKFAGEPGIKYGYITYYPGTPDHVDPPIEPTKLFMVRRVKPLKGCPWWEKDILIAMRLDEKTSDVAIVKNTPEMNARLWQVKHLVKILPIKCPDGLPKEINANGSYLHENGTFIVNHKISVDQKRIDAIDEFKNDWRKLDKETLRKELRLKWLNPL